jgi:hypothetical protein
MSIEAVMRRHEAQLMRLPNVSGIGIGERNGKEVVVVFVRQKVEESVLRKQDLIPETLEGYETDVRTEISVS